MFILEEQEFDLRSEKMAVIQGTQGRKHWPGLRGYMEAVGGKEGRYQNEFNISFSSD